MEDTPMDVFVGVKSSEDCINKKANAVSLECNRTLSDLRTKRRDHTAALRRR